MPGLGRTFHGCAHKTKWRRFDRTIGLAIYSLIITFYPETGKCIGGMFFKLKCVLSRCIHCFFQVL